MKSISATSRIIQLTASAAAVGLLAGCAGYAGKARDQALEHEVDAVATMNQSMKPPVMPMVVDTDDFYVSTKAVRLRDDVEMLPTMFRMPLRMQINPRASFKDVASQITKVSGLPFSFSSEVASEVARQSLNSGFSSDASLKSVLDSLCAQSSMSWRFRDGSVEIYRYETRAFQVIAPPGSTESSTQISNKNTTQSSGTTQSSSNNGQDFRQVSRVDFWSTTEAEIKQMLSPTVGKLVVSQASGTITVTDTPQVLNTIESYIKEVNYLRSRNVAISVQVYSVESNNSENVDFNLTGIFTRLNKYGLKMVSPTSGVMSGAGSLSATSTQASSSFNGSSALLQALNSIGNTAEVDKFSVVTVTGEPAPINSLINEGYLSKVTVQQATYSGGTPTQSLEPGTLTYGASGMLTPKLINGSDLQLRVALDLSSKLDITKVSASDGGSSIQLPKTASRSFAHTINIKSGETLLIGYQTSTSDYLSNSMLDPSVAASLLAGGNRKGSQLQRTLIYAITPLVTAPR